MEIAVTGHTGFIGRHLVVELQRRGHHVVLVDRDFTPVRCERIYHLACPATTARIKEDPTGVMDAIMDLTRKAMQLCPGALFVNASSYGAEDIAETAQGAYNVAKRCMEIYIQFSGVTYMNYRLPSVYGEDADPDSFIKRCVLGTAYKPENPDQIHYIAHVTDVVRAMASLKPVFSESITLGEIYESFNSGGRGLHWAAPDTRTV